MQDLGLKSYDKLYPMMIRKYSDLIVDQNASETDKINQIITQLNALGKLSNDVVRNWNTVYQWTMNDGLTTDVSNKVEEMKANGELDTVLQSVFASLAGDLSALHTTAKDNLVNSINEVDDLAKSNAASLAENTSKQQDNFGIVPTISIPDNSKTIAQAYPSVTLANVQSLDPNATLSDSASWYYLQTLVNLHKKDYWVINKNNRLTIPQGTYLLSRPLDLSNLGNTRIDFYGSMLSPFGTYSGYLVQFLSGYGRTFVDGLFIRGSWQCNGVNVQLVQNIAFDNLCIEFCFVGVRLAQVWYGNFSGQSHIGGCMTAVFFDVLDHANPSSNDEINTVGFFNLDISGALANDFTNFHKVQGTDKCYGFLIYTHSLGIKLIGVTIENTDRAFQFDDSVIGSAGLYARFSLSKIYCENTTDWIVYQNVTQAISTLQLDIDAPLLNLKANKQAFRLLQGTVSIHNVKANFVDYIIQIDGFTTYRPLILRTDANQANIINNSLATTTQIYFDGEATDAQFWDVNSYSDPSSGFANNPPPNKVMTPTIQDNLGYIGYTHVDIGYPQKYAMYKTIHSPSVKDLLFVDSTKGIILTDRNDGTYWRLYIQGGTLQIEQEKMRTKILNLVNVKDPKFFAHCTDSTQSGKYYCYELGNNPLVMVNGKWCQTISGTNYQCIGIGADFAGINNYPSGTWSYSAYNKEIGLYYNWESTYWGLGIVNGSGLNARSTKQAVGTTAQRPTGVATNFIYYDTTIVGYVQWNGTAWVSYTPTPV